MITAFKFQEFPGEMQNNKNDAGKDYRSEHPCQIHHQPDMLRVVVKAVVER
jgi:hypothetical protein